MKISKNRRDKRRTHYRPFAPTVAKDPTTGRNANLGFTELIVFMNG